MSHAFTADFAPRSVASVSKDRADGRARWAVLRSESVTPCGVEAFARRLAEAAGSRATCPVLGSGAPRGPGLGSGDALILNLPVVAWKRSLVSPITAAAAARLRGAEVVVVLHEWDDLDPKRRLSYGPILALATTVMFSSPTVARQFGRAAASRLTTSVRGLVPIPPNLSRPAEVSAGPIGARLKAERSRGRTIIGHFGSIYPKKCSAVVLDVAAELKARDEDPFVVFVGSFVRGSDSVEQDFHRRIRELGLEQQVMVTGFIEGEEELFGILDLADVFVYAFAEGLSARRASVYACLTTGRPILVNAPREAGEFDHHPAYRQFLSGGALRLLPHEATPEDFAEAVLRVRSAPTAVPAVDVAFAWQAAADAIDAGLARRRRMRATQEGKTRIEEPYAATSRSLP